MKSTYSYDRNVSFLLLSFRSKAESHSDPATATEEDLLDGRAQENAATFLLSTRKQRIVGRNTRWVA